MSARARKSDLVFFFNKQGKLIDQGYYDVPRWAYQHREGIFFVLTQDEVRNLPKKRDGRHRLETLEQKMTYRISGGKVIEADLFNYRD